MPSPLKNAKIGVRISLALMLPIVGLLIFSGMSILDKRGVASEMASLEELASLAPIVSSLVHELQKERGTSAVFIGSNGTKFAKELPLQWTLTSQKQGDLERALTGLDSARFSPALTNKIVAANDALAKLALIRKGVEGRVIPVPKMASYYTPTIAKLLKIVEEMAVLSTDARVTKSITAYTSLLEAKERAGLERAMGGAGFGAGKFAPGIYRKFLQLIAMQNAYLDTFAIYATSAQREFTKTTVAGEVVDEVERLRKIAIESPITNSVEGIGGPYWFSAITKKISLLKTVEDKVASDLAGLTSDIRSHANTIFMILLVVTAALLAFTGILVTTIVRGITGPVADLTDAMQKLANGDIGIDIPGLERADEVGFMAQAVGVFKQNAIDKARAESETASERAAREKRVKAVDQLIEKFEDKIGTVLSTVSTAVDTMEATSRGMQATAAKTTEQASSASAASEEASSNAATVAGAAEELSSTINEVSTQVARTNEVAQQAKDQAHTTNERVGELAEAAQKVGDVVNLISEIAEQTNLLALNATIEAARAGEAGRGFAVVATEVKDLASQTAKATEEISAHIDGIRNVTVEAVDAVQGISDTIESVNTISASVAAAMEEQQSATSEIARSIQQAAQGTSEVSVNIAGVSQSANESTEAATMLIESSTQLSEQSDNLKREVDVFLADVRTA